MVEMNLMSRVTCGLLVLALGCSISFRDDSSAPRSETDEPGFAAESTASASAEVSTTELAATPAENSPPTEPRIAATQSAEPSVDLLARAADDQETRPESPPQEAVPAAETPTPEAGIVSGDEPSAPAGVAERTSAPTGPRQIVRPPEVSAPRGRPSMITSARSSRPNSRHELSFDDIKFEMEKGAPYDPELLTDKIRSYEGKKIRIRGYILPGFQERGITEFVLVRDNMECCFGPGAALYDCILVQMAPGKTTSYSYRPIAVEGVFEIETFEGPDGYPLAIYRIQATLAR